MRNLNNEPRTHQYWLELMSNSQYAQEPIDYYSEGPLITALQNKVAGLLGKQSALFFHKGVAAQLTALKVISEKKNNNAFILHPQSHIAGDESQAYESLMHLRGILLGELFKPFDSKALSTITEPVGSLVVELPLRRAGFKLTPWNELQKIQSWTQHNNCHFHMDGARLWESTHHYQKSLAEIAAMADSVYVSFYKGIGGIAGAMLAGSEDFINACKVWRSRMGGDLYSAFPMIISALQGLDDRLPLIEKWVIRAHEIAKALNQFEQITVDQPHTNGFVIFVQGQSAELNNKKQQLDKKYNMRLTPGFWATAVPGIVSAELQVGYDSLDISTDEIIEYFQALLN